MQVSRVTEILSPADDIFAWHERPGAFERLTPPWQPAEVVSDHGPLEANRTVTLRIKVGPATVEWVARYESVTPGAGFVDVQDKGPFDHWRHAHRFDAIDALRTSVSDTIDFEAPAGPLGALAEPAIRRRVRRMLRYRHDVLAADLAWHARYASLPRQTIAITGASGLVGSALSTLLTTGGHRVVPMVRRAARAGEISWDPARGLNPADLEGVDAIVHLAGEAIVSGRWTEARKQRIRDSRVAGTSAIARAMASASNGPKILVSASAMGIYGDRGDEILDDEAAAGHGFLPDVAREWEAATTPASRAGVRVANARFGLILSPASGLLARMLPPFRMGIGGPLGNGTQWMSWISIDDCITGLGHLLFNRLEGTFNFGSPEPVTNQAFTEALGKVLRRPTVIPVPRVALRLAFGELADAGILASARMVPNRLRASGFEFRHAHLEPALRHLLGRHTG
ncbi:MAG: TIGR01777 family oxidoreductase [Gemmatimonadales bacterium]